MTSQLDRPRQWTTGNDPPTEKQTAFLKTLADSKGLADFNPHELNKSEASQKIEELKQAQPTSNASPNGSGAEKPIQDPNSWSTGGDLATGKQTGYVAAMAREAGEKVSTEGMSKTDASKAIEELKEKTGM